MPLKYLFVSTIRNTHSSVDKLDSQIYWTLYTAPPIPTFSPEQIWSSWHTLVALVPLTFSTHFLKGYIQVYLMSTERTPSWLSRAIRWSDISARSDSQGGIWLANQSPKISTLVQNFLLSSLNFRIHPYRASGFVPPGPKPPNRFIATNWTTSSVMSTGIKIDILPYTSNLEQGFTFQDRCNGFIHNYRFFVVPVHRVAALPLFPIHQKIWLNRAIFHI